MGSRLLTMSKIQRPILPTMDDGLRSDIEPNCNPVIIKDSLDSLDHWTVMVDMGYISDHEQTLSSLKKLPGGAGGAVGWLMVLRLW